MMQNLIPMFNLIDKALSQAGLDDKIELPKIAVIGSQSSGKSSVLESIAGFDFLPRGTGLVTRCPLIMQCIKTNTSKPYLIFSHKPDEKFSDFNRARQEIEDQTKVLAGSGKGIVKNEITVSIYSKDVVDLTLIDLPGFIKNATEDQSDSLPRDIKSMVKKYIIKESTFILAIHSATEDIANSESLQFARRYDKNGERTIGVITKVDLMDKGTNALNLLKGEEYQLKHGYVAVKGRSQQDIKDGKTVKDALAEEKKYFDDSPDYSKIAHLQGIKFLSKKISTLMQRHIEKSIPDIRNKIVTILSRDKARFDILSHQIDFSTEEGANSFIFDKISEYWEIYRELIQGTNVQKATEELRGGAKINATIDTSFRDVIDNMDPFSCLNDKEIRTAIANARGVNPELMIPEEAVRILIKQQIPRLDSPWKQFCQLVYDEMIKLVTLVEHEQLQKYGKLMNFIIYTMTELLDKYKTRVILMISNIIAAESALINFDHDDFVYLKPYCLNEKKIEEHDLVRIEQNLKVDRSFFEDIAESSDSDIYNKKAYNDQFEEDNTNYRIAELSEKEREYLPAYNPEDNIKKNADPIILKKVGDKLEVRDDPTWKEEKQVLIMKRLIVWYFSIVKKQIKDIIPKQVICHLVNETVKKMNSQLIKGLTAYGNKKEMLEEDPNDKFEREQVSNNVTALTQALTLIDKARTDPKSVSDDLMKSNVKRNKKTSFGNGKGKKKAKEEKEEEEEKKDSDDD